MHDARLPHQDLNFIAIHSPGCVDLGICDEARLLDTQSLEAWVVELPPQMRELIPAPRVFIGLISGHTTLQHVNEEGPLTAVAAYRRQSTTAA